MIMTIAQRLILLVSIAVLALVGLAGMGYHQIESVYNTTNLGNTNVVPSLKVLDGLRRDYLRTRLQVATHILNTDDVKMAEIETVLKGNRDAAAAEIKQYLGPDGCMGAACAADDKDK